MPGGRFDLDEVVAAMGLKARLNANARMTQVQSLGEEGVLRIARRPILTVRSPREPSTGLFVVRGRSLASVEVVSRLRQKDRWTFTWKRRKWKFEATLEDFELHPGGRFLGISLRIHDTPKERKLTRELYDVPWE